MLYCQFNQLTAPSVELKRQAQLQNIYGVSKGGPLLVKVELSVFHRMEDVNAALLCLSVADRTSH